MQSSFFGLTVKILRKMEQDNIITKECAHCHRTLPVTEYYKKKGTADGLQCYCKQCQKEINNVFKRKKDFKKVGGEGNPELTRFTPRQLMLELKARGYTGELKYVQTINLEKL